MGRGKLQGKVEAGNGIKDRGVVSGDIVVAADVRIANADATDVRTAPTSGGRRVPTGVGSADAARSATTADDVQPATAADDVHPATAADDVQPATAADTTRPATAADAARPATAADAARPATAADTTRPATAADAARPTSGVVIVDFFILYLY